MAEETNVVSTEQKTEAGPFVSFVLGPWSSHPSMLLRQKFCFLLVGCIPLALGIVFALLVCTNYRPEDFAAVGKGDWSAFWDAAKTIWHKISVSAIAILAGLCVTWSFSVTMGLLWGLSRKISLRSEGTSMGRDSMPCPPAFLIAIACFWLAPVLLSLFKTALVAMDYRLYYGLLILSVACCFAPFVFLRLWVLKADAGKGPPEYRHSYLRLFLWIFFVLLSLLAAFYPDSPSVLKFVNGSFSDFIQSRAPWLPRLLDVTIERLFWCVKMVVALFFAWCGIMQFLAWRLSWVKRNSPKKVEKKEEREPEGEIPPSAAYLLGHLPDGIELEGSLEEKIVSPFSPPSHRDDGVGLRYLIDIPGDGTPTEDQAAYFHRFVESYEQARDGFFENEDPRAPQKQADILLYGSDGSGRTTALLASALYAAIVRGQRVLYMVPSRDMGQRLAKRINARLRALMVDCYFSAGVLKPIEVGSWLDAYCVDPENVLPDPKETLPPDILFATPEMVERSFFSNVATIDVEKREAMRKLLLDFNVFLVDDFLEYPLSVRSHLAFVLDKFRLLLATEYVVPQFVVATTPLDAENCVDILGQRLFGFNRFNRRKNVCELKPRQLSPYVFGTLIVRKGKTLDVASRELLQVSLQENFKTLLYRRGISDPEKAKLDEDFKDQVKDGALKVVSHLYELDERKVFENIFYLSLTCGNADAALRLNMADSGRPVFFRIKMEGEEDSVDRDAVVLVPDETAISLRAFHLRSILQFVPRLTPIEASVWSCLGIFKDHPNIKDAVFLEDAGSRVSIQWFQDDLPPDERYAEGQIWPYLVLASSTTISTRGQMIDFNVLPNSSESIWIDRHAVGREANRLLLARDDDGADCRHMVSWRDAKNVVCGETDLAHSDEMVCRRKGMDGEDADEYTVAGLPSQDIIESDPGRFAMAVTARFRRGTEEEFLYPIKRLRWTVPTRELEVVDLSRLDGLAHFKMQSKGDATIRVDGMLKGLLNLRGKELDYYPPRDFAYEAYMTCLVLHPQIQKLAEKSRPEEYVLQCMSGRWITDPEAGFSSALTHALTAAFRHRFSGWSFFAMAPAFYIEGRQGSIGKVVLWLIEPANSGRTAGPVLKSLFEQSAFWRDLFGEAYDLLSGCQSLLQLRTLSRLAFAGESWNEDDRAKALAILEPMKEEPWDDDSGEGDDSETEEGESGDGNGKVGVEPEVRKSSAEFSPEEKEFETAVIQGLLNFEDTIDLTDTQYVKSHGKDPDAVYEFFNDILWNHPEIFYISKNARYQYWTSSAGEIVKLVVRDIPYAISQEEFPAAKSRLDAATRDAIEYMESRLNGSEKPEDKARLLHDYIVRVCEYDTEARDTHDSSPAARTVYSVLVRHKAVCEGYTMAYRYLLDRVGVTSEEVLSDRMNHCWNYVRIGDHWYHVDVTWDDPVYQGRQPHAARISHDHFLLSDFRIKTRKHRSWNVRGLPPATDTSFDDVDWDGSGPVQHK